LFVKDLCLQKILKIATTTTILRPFFRDNPGEPVPEENFWTSWCEGRLQSGQYFKHGKNSSLHFLAHALTKEGHESLPHEED